MDKAKYVKISQQQREKQQKTVDDLKKNINKIKSYLHSAVIKYPNYKEVFEYVDRIFTDINVKEIIVYKVSKKNMIKLGFGNAGGFYDRLSKTVVISSSSVEKYKHNQSLIQAKITTDEVLVHELIHYCYNEFNIFSKTDQHEEFAYGWSIGYLRQKGYTDEQIIKNNFLPYLVNSISNDVFKNILLNNNIKPSDYNNYSNAKKIRISRQFNKECEKQAIVKAYKRGQELIDIYSKKINNETVSHKKNNVSRYTLLDL